MNKQQIKIKCRYCHKPTKLNYNYINRLFRSKMCCECGRLIIVPSQYEVIYENETVVMDLHPMRSKKWTWILGRHVYITRVSDGVAMDLFKKNGLSYRRNLRYIDRCMQKEHKRIGI